MLVAVCRLVRLEGVVVDSWDRFVRLVEKLVWSSDVSLRHQLVYGMDCLSRSGVVTLEQSSSLEPSCPCRCTVCYTPFMLGRCWSKVTVIYPAVRSWRLITRMDAVERAIELVACCEQGRVKTC